jgi:hypothetical protein
MMQGSISSWLYFFGGAPVNRAVSGFFGAEIDFFCPG